MVIVRGEPDGCAKKRINQNGENERREAKLNKKRNGNSTNYHERVREFLLIGSLRRETKGYEIESDL
jgi:hypothetical protein